MSALDRAATCAIAALMTFFLIVLAPAAAYAVSQTITGATPDPGALVNYTTARYHARTGTISMAMATTAQCGGSTALSLRDTSNTHFTTSPTWTSPTGTKVFGLATTGSQLIPAKTFYVSARMRGACFNDRSERYFSGTLTF
ncbi:hypothetical protein N1031_07340 [Herbiconiux moechotypicola]|uniref:Uncharacterized protein n=1 Tax=Herbiconiux moechotypicola TaxID=637393 RepID=A0ABN3DGV3_9MICO|nr:hypothetical protein [Herbiconiux moechotypicola]MCS5729571.1 hypothetical protein [Herbiconiux moechotypicola]